jgi:hypothetical protein
MSLEKQLDKLPHASLKTIILSLYDIHDDIDDIIEQHLKAAKAIRDKNVENRIANFTKELDKLLNSGLYYDYRDSGYFASQLNDLREEINDTIREYNLMAALELTEYFIGLVGPAMEMADDSCGEISDVFMTAMDQWLDIAAEVRRSNPDYLDWATKVQEFHKNDDYGCLQYVIKNSAVLLSKEELLELAEQFTAEAESNPDRSDGLFGIRCVAEALGDINLYERSYTLGSSELNEVQMRRIVDFALTISDTQRAQYWLDRPDWDRSSTYHKNLVVELLKKQGNTVQLKNHFMQDFEQTPNEHTLKTYWEVATQPERETIQQQLEVMADNPEYRHSMVGMLQFVDAFERAAKYVIQHASKIDGGAFYTVKKWAELFAQKQKTLAAILCYRALLTSLLERGYAKAYHHGGDYFRVLLELDKTNPDYAGFDDAQGYIRQLQNKHWRKRSFWAEAGHPNKP